MKSGVGAVARLTEKKAKIVILNNQGLAAVGGGVTILRRLVAGLYGTYDLSVFSYDAPSDCPPGVLQVQIEPPVAVHGPGWRFAPLYRARHLQHVLPKEDIQAADLVIAFDCHFAPALRQFRPMRLVYLSLSCIPRMEWFSEPGLQGALRFLQYAWLERLAATIADEVIVASELHRDEMRRYELLPSLRPQVCYPVFPTETIPVMRRPNGDLVTILSAARLVPVKNFDAVLDLAFRLRDLPCRFVIAGDGPEGEKLRTRAMALGVADRVIFVGAVSDLHEHLSRADIFLHTSRYESFGMAVFEAMRAGVPVALGAGRYVTAYAEYVQDGIAGYLLDLDRPDDAAVRLRRLVCDRTLREEMGKGARRAAGHLLKQDYVARFEGIIARLLSAAKNRTGNT